MGAIEQSEITLRHRDDDWTLVIDVADLDSAGEILKSLGATGPVLANIETFDKSEGRFIRKGKVTLGGGKHMASAVTGLSLHTFCFSFLPKLAAGTACLLVALAGFNALSNLSFGGGSSSLASAPAVLGSLAANYANVLDEAMAQRPVGVSVSRLESQGRNCNVYVRFRNLSDELVPSIFFRTSAVDAAGRDIGQSIASSHNVRAGGEGVGRMWLSGVDCTEIAGLRGASTGVGTVLNVDGGGVLPITF